MPKSASAVATLAAALGLLLLARTLTPDPCEGMRWVVTDDPACHVLADEGLVAVGTVDECATVCERLHWHAASSSARRVLMDKGDPPTKGAKMVKRARRVLMDK